MADITATLTGQVTITGELTVPMGIVPRGEIEVTENGNYDVTNYETAQVAVPQPSGSVTITENGQHDVTDYVTADVQVPQPSGSIEITENGTVDVTDFVQAVVNVRTTVLTGSFKTPDVQDAQEILDIPYTGNGYPIAVLLMVKGGMFDPSNSGWQNSVRNSVGLFGAVKEYASEPPTYDGQLTANRATAFAAYNYNGPMYLRTSIAVQNNTYTNPSTSSYLTTATWASSTKLRYNVRGTNRNGLCKNCEYEYIVVYSE